MCIPARVFMLWLRRDGYPKSRKLEEGRLFHTKSVKRDKHEVLHPPIVTGGVEIRRMACSFLSKSNGGAGKGAVSATWTFR